MTIKAVGCSLNFKNPAHPDYYLVVQSEKVIALHLGAMTFSRGIPHSRKVLILITYPPPSLPKTSVYAKVYAAGFSAIIIAGVSAT